jgi:hypothetical protein
VGNCDLVFYKIQLWMPYRNSRCGCLEDISIRFVTEPPIRGFIYMNAPTKDILPHELSPVSIFGPFPPVLYGGIGRRGARTADASASHQSGPGAEP